VVALNTDGLGDSAAVTPDVIEAALRKAGFPFDHARISATGLQALDHLNRAVLDRWKPLPLPVTFLLDAHGELTALYKGPVAAAQLVADAKLSAASATDRRAAAVPFAGRWVDEQASRFDPKRVASLMLDHDESEAAIRYLDVCVASLSPRVNEPGLAAQLGDIHYMAGLLKNAHSAHRAAALTSLVAARDLLPKDVRVRKSLGETLFAAGRGEEAAAELAAALNINPADTALMAELADLYQRLGQYEPSQTLLEQLLAANPKDGLTRYHLAGVQVKAGQPQAALPNYRQALRDAPRLLDAANDLARVLAAHPDEAVRSADEAVALARRLCLMSRNANPKFLDTLGLALASQGEFSAAAEAVRAAIALLPPADETSLRPLRERLNEYEAGKAVRLREP
jgi:tetratricopeptide (TPR) repeat protein